MNQYAEIIVGLLALYGTIMATTAFKQAEKNAAMISKFEVWLNMHEKRLNKVDKP